MITIKNIASIGHVTTHKIKIHAVIPSSETYQFRFRYNDDVLPELTYNLHRDIKTAEGNFVGTLQHKFGSWRHDCYECDILDKMSFLDFLQMLAEDWYKKYKK